jgi:hypothetical protein
MKELRDIFANVKEQGDLDKRLLEVFEMGVRAGAEAMESFYALADPDMDFDPVEGVVKAVMDEMRPWKKP